MIIKKLLCVIAILVFCNQLYAQDVFAVIKDSDGFVNVHEDDLQSKVTGKILKFQPFDSFEGEKEYQKYAGMVYVEYSHFANPKVNSCAYNQENEQPLTGYIHKSRICRLDKMPTLKLRSLKENKAVYGNSEITVEIETAKFDYKKHVIKDEKGQLVKASKGYADAISVDGERIWGTDGDIPREEIKSIKIIYSDTIITLSSSDIKNIFEPNIDSQFTKICIGPDNEIYIWMQNGDGAASYNVIWVLTDKKQLYRFTRLSYYV